jgi:hypothetical protein
VCILFGSITPTKKNRQAVGAGGFFGLARECLAASLRRQAGEEKIKAVVSARKHVAIQSQAAP